MQLYATNKLLQIRPFTNAIFRECYEKNRKSAKMWSKKGAKLGPMENPLHWFGSALEWLKEKPKSICGGSSKKER